jgi:predicted nucleic acid-binding protein
METGTKSIIVDSSGLISLIVPGDSNHAAAVQAAHALDATNATALIPAEVFAETLNVLGKFYGHQGAAGTVQAVLESSAFAVIPSSDTTRLDALDQFRGVPNGVSYTDCLVMQTAYHRNTRDIFGFDTTFRKHGYTTPPVKDKAA